MTGYDSGLYDLETYDFIPGSKYYVTINDTEVTRIKSFTVEKNLTQYSGKFNLTVSDPVNALYDTVTSGDEVIARRRSDDFKVFGGYCEKIERNKDQRYVLDIQGGDYTTKLNDILVLAQIYNGREHSVIIRDLMNKYVIDANIIDNCDVINTWNATGATLSLETGVDTNNYLISRLGDGCLKLVPTGTSITLNKTVSSAKTINATDYITMYYYIEDATKLSSVGLNLGQDSSNYYVISAPNQTIVNGWNYIEFDVSTKITGAGSPTLADVDYYRINTTLTDTSNIIYVDDIRQTANTDETFTLSKVQTTEYYAGIKFKNVSVFDSLKKICDLRPDLDDFYIDINRILNYGEFGELSSGETLQRGANVLKSEFWDDDTKLVNKVTVYGAKQEFNYSDTFDGDATTKEFTLIYEPITQTVTVGGIELEGYVLGMSPSEYDYQVDKENKIIKFNNAPASGSDNVVISYTYGVPIIVQRQDDVSIANYRLRETKIENEFLLKKDDVTTVAQEFVDAWKNPILNAKYSIRINPNIDIGETVEVIDEKYFGDSVARTFGVVSLKHTLIGRRSGTAVSLTQITRSVEMYLQDIFNRLNALEEADKGDRDVLARLLSFSENLNLTDDPENNLTADGMLMNDSFVLGDLINGVVYDADETAILEDFESAATWSNFGLTQTLSNDSTTGHYWVGTQGLKSTWTETSGLGRLWKNIPSVDLSPITGVASGYPSGGTVGLWIYVEGTTPPVSYVQVLIGNDSSNWIQYECESYAQRQGFDVSFDLVLHDGLNYLLFDLNSPGGSMGTVDWTTIDYIKLHWGATAAGVITFDYLTASKSDNIGLNGLGDRATVFEADILTGQSD